MQIANFLVCGALVLAYAFGLRRALGSGVGSRSAPILLGIFGACLIGSGIFVTDPILGYPPVADARLPVRLIAPGDGANPGQRIPRHLRYLGAGLALANNHTICHWLRATGSVACR